MPGALYDQSCKVCEGFPRMNLGPLRVPTTPGKPGKTGPNLENLEKQGVLGQKPGKILQNLEKYLTLP